MRVLLALDGSSSADAARQAVKALNWPQGSVVHVLGVVEPQRIPTSVAPLTMPLEAVEPRYQEDLQELLAAAAASIREPHVLVDAQVVVGRPATVIVETAASLRAELIVVGSRGRGPLASMVLGSVSAEVVNQAKCGVLVVRETLEGPVLVATDGSNSAEGAVSYLIGHRLFVDREVNVLSVAARSVRRAGDEITGLARGAWADALDPGVPRDWALAEEHAARATARLNAAGYRARMTIAAGDPAHQIIEAAEDFGSALIVTGSRGLTGLRGLLLGSVARNVLLHSSASVLVVHEPLREVSPEQLAAARPRLTGVPTPA